jgi:hypothetical protein
MHKSNFQPGALELGEPVLDSSDIKLCGIEALIECDELIKLGKGSLSPECEFSNAVGLNYRCYYLLQQILNNEIVLHERGVGTVVKRRRSFFLEREFPVVWGDHPKTMSIVRNNGKPTNFNVPGHLRVSSVIPPTYIEALASPFSVIASIHPFNPTPVEIEENSLLGRIGDVIQSVDMDELREMTSIGDDAIKALEDTQKQLKLKARRIDLTRKDAVISAPILRATPKYTTTTRPKAQQGSIIFNSDTKCLEFFDGQDWVSIKGHRDGAL